MEDRRGKSRALIASVAIGTGLINGLFGAGGGMIAVVALERLLHLETKKAHATALFIMLPLSVISLVIYFLNNKLVLNNFLFIFLGALPGSFLGAKILGRMNSIWINRMFCILMFAAGVRLIL